MASFLPGISLSPGLPPCRWLSLRSDLAWITTRVSRWSPKPPSILPQGKSDRGTHSPFVQLCRWLHQGEAVPLSWVHKNPQDLSLLISPMPVSQHAPRPPSEQSQWTPLTNPILPILSPGSLLTSPGLTRIHSPHTSKWGWAPSVAFLHCPVASACIPSCLLYHGLCFLLPRPAPAHPASTSYQHLLPLAALD